MQPIADKPDVKTDLYAKLPVNDTAKPQTDALPKRVDHISQAIKEEAKRQQNAEPSSILGRPWRQIKSMFTDFVRAIARVFSNLFAPNAPEVFSSSATRYTSPSGSLRDTPYTSPSGSVASSFRSPVETMQTMISGIPNHFNGCYRIASNQALRMLTPFLVKISQPLQQMQGEANEDFQNREGIRQALIGLIDCLEQGKSAQDIEIADTILLLAVAKSRLCPSLSEDDLTQQQDAAAYVEVILSSVLADFHTSQVKLIGMNSKGAEYSSLTPIETYSVMQLPITKSSDLQTLVDEYFTPEEINNPDDAWKPESGISISNYLRIPTQLSDPKEMLAIQLKRAEYDPAAIQAKVVEQLKKYKLNRQDVTDDELKLIESSLKEAFGSGGVINDKQIKFPHANLLDLSLAYGKPKRSLQYALKSFVCHEGISSNSGHYTAYVNNYGQWYYCDDNRVTPVSEWQVDVAKERAYMLFFEKKSV